MQGESEQKERIRAANPASALTIAALNASVYSCAMSQALEKFEAKLVDGILCPTDTPKGFGLGAYVRCGTVAPFSYQFVFMKVMNQAKWNSLPASVQAVFNEVNAKWPEYYGKLRTWGEYDGLQYCYATIPGFYMYDLPTLDPTEYQLWVDKCYPGLKDTWIAVSPATRGALWGNYTANQTYYDTTPPWSTWTHSWPTPPAPPTFP
jgi:TRAP-type C4-dicarboxylate transport system substrate-binding protein